MKINTTEALGKIWKWYKLGLVEHAIRYATQDWIDHIHLETYYASYSKFQRICGTYYLPLLFHDYIVILDVDWHAVEYVPLIRDGRFELVLPPIHDSTLYTPEAEAITMEPITEDKIVKIISLPNAERQYETLQIDIETWSKTLTAFALFEAISGIETYVKLLEYKYMNTIRRIVKEEIDMQQLLSIILAFTYDIEFLESDKTDTEIKIKAEIPPITLADLELLISQRFNTYERLLKTKLFKIEHVEEIYKDFEQLIQQISTSQ